MDVWEYDPYDEATHFFPAPKYTLGLDLGKAKDYTALVILERHGEAEEAIFHARHLERFPLGTPYPKIVADVAAMLHKPPLSDAARPAERPRLAVDETGVGSPVVDLFRQADLAGRLYPVHITGGATVNHANGVEYVPKRDLVSVVQVALQTDKLKIARALPEAQTLVRELQDFEVKITDSANDTYGAWREGTHDDLVLAVALALWVGKKIGEQVMGGHSFSYRSYNGLYTA
jgi:hypothetical protein